MSALTGTSWLLVRRFGTIQNASLSANPERLDKNNSRMTLTQTKGRRIEASKWLGWGRNTLTRKIHELRMDGEVERAARQALCRAGVGGSGAAAQRGRSLSEIRHQPFD